MKINAISQNENNNKNFKRLVIHQTLDLQSKTLLPLDFIKKLSRAQKELDNIHSFDMIVMNERNYKVIQKVLKDDTERKTKHPFLKKIFSKLFLNFSKKPFDYYKNLEIEMENAGRQYTIDYRNEEYHGCWPDIPSMLTSLWTDLDKKNIQKEYAKFKQLDKFSQAVYLTKLLDEVERKKATHTNTLQYN